MPLCFYFMKAGWCEGLLLIIIKVCGLFCEHHNAPSMLCFLPTAIHPTQGTGSYFLRVDEPIGFAALETHTSTIGPLLPFRGVQDIGARYPDWLEANRDSLSPEDLQRYSRYGSFLSQTAMQRHSFAILPPRASAEGFLLPLLGPSFGPLLKPLAAPLHAAGSTSTSSRSACCTSPALCCNPHLYFLIVNFPLFPAAGNTSSFSRSAHCTRPTPPTTRSWSTCCSRHVVHSAPSAPRKLLGPALAGKGGW